MSFSMVCRLLTYCPFWGTGSDRLPQPTEVVGPKQAGVKVMMV